METPLTFCINLSTSNRVQDLPYKGNTPKAAVNFSEDDSAFEAIRNYRDPEDGAVNFSEADSAFEAIRNYRDLEDGEGPSNTNSTVKKVLSGLPLTDKKFPLKLYFIF